MARIPGPEDMGQVIARPMRYAETQVPHAAFGTPIAAAMMQIGGKMMAEEEAADRANASFEVSKARVELKAQAEQLGEDMLLDRVSREEAPAEWQSRSKGALADAVERAPVRMRNQVQQALEVEALGIGQGLSRVASAKNRSDVRASLLGQMEILSRDALRDRPAAVTKASQLMDVMGAAAGYGADDRVQMLNRFRESAAFNEAADLIRAADRDPEELARISKRLRTDEFRDLAPERVGQLEQLVEATSERERNRQERDAARQESEAWGRVLLQIETGQKIDAEDWSLLGPAHRAGVINRQKAEAKQRRMEAEGRPVRTDWSLYLDLRQQALDDPAKFSKVDLGQFVDRIGGAQLEQLADVKGRLVEQVLRPNKASREAVTLTQQMNATMASLKIRRPDDKGKFVYYVTNAIDDASQAKGKALTFDERQQIIDDAAMQGPDPDAWLWGQKRAYELTPEQRTRFRPNAAADAPETEVDALNEALRAQGIPQTPVNRLSLYNRARRPAQ